MGFVLNVPTVMLCVSITVLLVAVSLTLMWVHDPREKAIQWWCIGLWVAVIGTGLFALRAVLPAWLAIGGTNAFVTFAFGLAAGGYSVFTGGKPNLPVALAGPAVWLVAYAAFPGFHENLAYRATFMTVILGSYCLSIVAYAWRGWKIERLPSFLATVVLYSIHVCFYVGRAILAYIYPVTDSLDQTQSTWVAVSAIEAFAMSIFSTFMFFALIKERAERKYRLAAEIDGLTGAATRRFFVSETRARLAKTPKAGVLAVIDLDYFKSVNDCYGHLGGDRVLQAFGMFVNNRLEPGMVFGRLGGEEFGLFLPDMEASQARTILEGIRADVEAMPISFMGSPIRITISLGAASVREAGVDFDHLMAAADSALYLAKEDGRNRLRVFSLSMRMHPIVEGGMETRLGLTEQRLSRMTVRSRIGGN